MTRRLLCLMLAVALILSAASCKSSSEADGGDDQDALPVSGVYLNNIAVNIIENDQNGSSFSLESLKGRVILLVFSAMWCTPCRLEASELIELYNTYKERGLEIVQCIFDDRTEAGMARQLGISAHTIHTHLERLYRKLGVSTRCAAVVCVFVEYFKQHPTARAARRSGDRMVRSQP